MTREPGNVAEAFDQIEVPDHEQDVAWVMRGVATDVVGPVVFLVHPTTASSQDSWFADPLDPPFHPPPEAVVRSQAAAFPGLLWAPRYRQATTRAFHERDGGGEEAYDLAYDDVSRAFAQFLVDDARRQGPRRPLVLVGHSQGARHVRALLAEFFDHRELADRLVAAYVVGVEVRADDAVLQQFRVATAADDAGVLVTYQARLASPAPASVPARAAEPRAVCVEPAAIGVTSDDVTAVDGYLELTRERAGAYAERALPDGRLHPVEIEVLQRVLSTGVRRRTRAWRERQPVAPGEEKLRDVAQSRVATLVPESAPCVELWPGVRGSRWWVPGGLIHGVDLAGPEHSTEAPAVLLHKLGGWVAEWRAVAERLSATRRVVVLDLPGHGASVQNATGPWVHWPQESARTVRAVLDQLGIERAHVMGCSLGGVVGAWLAAHRPERVVSLTLLGSSLTPRLSAARTLEIDRAVAPGFGPGWVPRPGQNARAATTDPQIVAEQDASRARAGTWVRASERGVGLAGVDHVISRVIAPVLYVNGERAGYRSYEDAVTQLVPGARVAVVPDAGAFVHQERPDEVADLWTGFVADRG